jgi:hypothetical protein
MNIEFKPHSETEVWIKQMQLQTTWNKLWQGKQSEKISMEMQ